MARLRPNAKAVNTFQFGAQVITTKVNVMVPSDAPREIVDVTAAMHVATIGHDVLDDMFGGEGGA